MADFCHNADPGGLGCVAVGWPVGEDRVYRCGLDCYGDFTEDVRAIRAGEASFLGLCEAHGFVFAGRDDSGTAYFIELPLPCTTCSIRGGTADDKDDEGVGRDEVLAAFRQAGAPDSHLEQVEGQLFGEEAD